MGVEDEHGDRLRIGPWVPDPFEAPRPTEPADRPEPVTVPIAADAPAVEPPAAEVSRRRHRATGTGRRWLVVAAIVAVLGGAAAVPLLGSSSSPPRPGGAAAPVPSGAAGAPVIAGSDSPSPSPVASRSTVPRPAKSPPRPAPAPVTYEAEAPGNELGGTAWVDDYPGASGGRIVRNIGVWNSPRKEGSLRFNGVTAPATGTYLLSFFSVHLDGESVRTAVITVSGSPPVTVSVGGDATCCAVTRQRVTLRQGANTVTFSNPTGHAPSIDKIVIGPA